MAFLDNFGKKVSEAAQAAAKKSGELVEITKINMNISSEEDKMQKLYTEMGKIIYKKYCSTDEVAEEFIEMCNTIKSHEENITNLKQKVYDIKNVKLCTECGAELEKTAAFCPKCGSKQPIAEVKQEEPASPKICPSCGVQIGADSVFCTNCGTKVD